MIVNEGAKAQRTQMEIDLKESLDLPIMPHQVIKYSDDDPSLTAEESLDSISEGLLKGVCGQR